MSTSSGRPALPDYPVRCYAPGCDAPARFKVAAAWSDGITRELKTYSLCCEAHLHALFGDACARRGRCRLAPGEILDRPGIYEWYRGRRDAELPRRPDLEATD